MKAGFAETDATKLKVGQPAAVSFSALPNVQAAGVVTSVDVSSTLVSNVVTYFATVTLTQVPAGVKPGMTASVTITVDRREGVLNLPSAAVRGTGIDRHRHRLNGKTQTTKTVGVGLRGDTTTEITSGLERRRHGRALPSSTVSGVSSQLGTGYAVSAAAALGGGLGGGLGGATRWRRRAGAVADRCAGPLLALEHVEKRYDAGEISVVALRDVEPRDHARRVRRGDGRVGQRQEHADEHPRLPRPADAGQVRPRRDRRALARRHRSRGGAQPVHRLRVPELQPDPAHRARSATSSCRWSTRE